MLNKKFTFDDKKLMSEKIKGLNNKKKYFKIFDIVKKNYKKYTTNKNGVFFNLNALNDRTLNEINEVINENNEIDTISNDIDSESYISNVKNDTESYSDSSDFDFKEIKLVNLNNN